MILTLDQLKAIAPKLPVNVAENYLPYINAALEKYEINTALRISAFLAQLMHESVQLTAFEEYASGKAYEGRKDLGNTKLGDGVRYKGRGAIQLTGRANYRQVGQALGVDLENNPTLASDPSLAFLIAGYYWNSRKLNKFADSGIKGFNAITYRINGGYRGKADRLKYYSNIRIVLGIPITATL